jgi:hypothetical protein
MVSGATGPAMLPTKRSHDAPEKFKGHYSKVKSFLCQYERLLTQHQMTTDKDKCEGITNYCGTKVVRLIESLDEYREYRWDDLKKKLLNLYDADIDEALYNWVI